MYRMLHKFTISYQNISIDPLDPHINTCSSDAMIKTFVVQVTLKAFTSASLVVRFFRNINGNSLKVLRHATGHKYPK